MIRQEADGLDQKTAKMFTEASSSVTLFPFFLAKSNMMFLQIRHCIFQHFRLRKHGLVGFFVIGSLVQYLLDILLCGRLIRFRGICLRGRL